jgi:hypothetical protein
LFQSNAKLSKRERWSLVFCGVGAVGAAIALFSIGALAQATDPKPGGRLVLTKAMQQELQESLERSKHAETAPMSSTYIYEGKPISADRSAELGLACAEGLTPKPICYKTEAELEVAETKLKAAQAQKSAK